MRAHSLSGAANDYHYIITRYCYFFFLDVAENDEQAITDVQNEETSQRSKEMNLDDDKTVTSEGLIYQKVGYLKSHPADAPPIQTEAPTTYADLDFARTAAANKK